MRFLDWCRTQHNLRDLAQIDAQADELACLYFTERIAQGHSAWMLITERSALRMFFQNRQLAHSVAFLRRKRADIKRSRGPAKRDAHINLDNWRHVITFCLACGLRREEMNRVCHLEERDERDRENPHDSPPINTRTYDVAEALDSRWPRSSKWQTGRSYAQRDKRHTASL